MGDKRAAQQTVVVADAGPLLHLAWVRALEWALPEQSIDVVEEVWQEVALHVPSALGDKRLRRIPSPSVIPPELDAWALDAGERASLAHALSISDASDVLLLCDERQARAACAQLSLPVTGSIGLIVAAALADRVDRELAIRSLRDLSTVGRLHVRSELIEEAVRTIKEAPV